MLYTVSVELIFDGRIISWRKELHLDFRKKITRCFRSISWNSIWLIRADCVASQEGISNSSASPDSSWGVKFLKGLYPEHSDYRYSNPWEWDRSVPVFQSSDFAARSFVYKQGNRATDTFSLTRQSVDKLPKRFESNSTEASSGSKFSRRARSH